MTDQAAAVAAEPAAQPAAPVKADPTALPEPPQKAQPSEDALVAKVATSVIQTLKQAQAAQAKAPPKGEDPIDAYFEQDKRGFFKNYGEVIKEETKRDMIQQFTAQRAFEDAYEKEARKYEGIASVPEVVEAEIVRAQQEYKAKHGADLPAHEALKPAMARAAKRVPGVKEKSEEDINNAQLPGSGGGYNPQGRAVKMTSTEDWVKQQQQINNKFKVKAG